jgi:hypothetical protein
MLVVNRGCDLEEPVNPGNTNIDVIASTLRVVNIGIDAVTIYFLILVGEKIHPLVISLGH